ncbi:MAG: KAP family NTPase [Muribaculaceae bacterium]|nr:KAP family NTPase [Muribaculaceae bacterium]
MNDYKNFPKKSSLSDTPLELPNNDFGTDKYVKGLVNFIERSAAPITIALKGEWGSGKTSLMNRLHNDLCSENKNFIGVKINTWEYSMLATPEETVVKIIIQLVRSLSNNDPSTSEKLKNFTKTAINFVYRGTREWGKKQIPFADYAIEALGVPTEIFSGQGTPENISLSDLRIALTNAIAKTLSEKNKNGIIVFVDDLDRLNPPLAVQILELLKNIFTLDNCIFILAIDYEVVVKGLEPKYGPYKPENDREFRSFFDKIIQVPFSLPVGNYDPINFVLDSLMEIDFINTSERHMTRFKQSIEKIVNYSVGKNPRAIKRLINTLSLLNCISQYSDQNQNTPDYKLINFAIVSLQVCYQKIYDMLSINPDFDRWDVTIAAKLGVHNAVDSEELNGDTILDALCEKEIFYDQHHSDILGLIRIIKECALEIDRSNPDKIVRDLMRSSSVTNVSNSESVGYNNREIINRLHSNVATFIKRNRPEIDLKPKRNTGNGGFIITLDNNTKSHVVFSLSEDELLTLGITLGVKNGRPERLANQPFSMVMNDDAVQQVIEPMHHVVKEYTSSGLIHPVSLFNGETYTDIVEEYKVREDELWDSISGDLSYRLKVNSVTDYEDTRMVRTISDLIIAAYDMNNRALKIK